jgi:DNA-binding transcriptional ArsR family regulator
MKLTIAEPGIARVANMIGDPTRAAMLEALLAGPALPAGELARRARVAPSTASAHLARLVGNGLIVRRRSGRHRYYMLAGADVAAALEALSRVASPGGKKDAGTNEANRRRDGRKDARKVGPPAHSRELHFARTCYDHLAGTLGVLLTDTLLAREFITAPGFAVSAAGEMWLSGLDIDVNALKLARRAMARPCLDWSERRDHLAGAAGAAIATMLLDRHWIARLDDTRAVRLTQRGRDGLYRVLGIEIEDVH